MPWAIIFYLLLSFSIKLYKYVSVSQYWFSLLSMKYFLLLILFLGTCHHQLHAQSAGQRTYCNPMDINYRYNFEQLNDSISYRSAADPVIINHQGEYYLFATISGGWWHSKNLLNWDYVVPSMWPMEDMCAPAALSVRDTLFPFSVHI
jgi:xylan 1,4-beta-xylosidase